MSDSRRAEIWAKATFTKEMFAVLEQNRIDLERLTEYCESNQQSIRTAMEAIMRMNNEGMCLAQCECGRVIGLNVKVCEGILRLRGGKMIKCLDCGAEFWDKFVSDCASSQMKCSRYLPKSSILSSI